MSIAWLVIFIILWTGFLAGIASLVTSGRVQARFAQLVWRGAALLSVAPLAVIGLSKLIPARLPAALPDIPYVEPAAGLMTSATTSLKTAVSGPEWSWTVPALMTVLDGTVRRSPPRAGPPAAAEIPLDAQTAPYRRLAPDRAGP